METNILEAGGTENSMVLAYGYQFKMLILAVKLLSDKVNGQMENVNDGYLQLKFFTALPQGKKPMQIYLEDDKFI